MRATAATTTAGLFLIALGASCSSKARCAGDPAAEICENGACKCASPELTAAKPIDTTGATTCRGRSIASTARSGRSRETTLLHCGDGGPRLDLTSVFAGEVAGKKSFEVPRADWDALWKRVDQSGWETLPARCGDGSIELATEISIVAGDDHRAFKCVGDITAAGLRAIENGLVKLAARLDPTTGAGASAAGL